MLFYMFVEKFFSQFQIFDLFFGGGGRRRPQGKRKGEDIESGLKVTLEQLYNGATRKMAISKDVICDSCDGHGGPKDAILDCNLCSGTVSANKQTCDVHLVTWYIQDYIDNSASFSSISTTITLNTNHIQSCIINERYQQT